jgi:hypothetical protein
MSTLDSIFHKQTFVTHSITFTDGDADKYNFVHGGPGVGIHVRVGSNASCVTRQKTVVRCAGVRAAINGQSVLEVCGKYVVAMQYDSEQKLCEK